MARTLNKVMIIGNVGREPDLKFTPSGIPVASFRLATTDSWKDRNGKWQEHTDWHTIVAWRGLAEVCHKILTKGAKIYIEGKLQSRTIDDKNNRRIQIVEVVAENMLVLDGKRTKENGSNGDTRTESIYGINTDFNDDNFDDSSRSFPDPFDDFDSYDVKSNDDIPF